jgi:hypothetical protein
MNKKRQKCRPVIIKWVDITSWVGWNDELYEENRDVPTPFKTIGFLIRKAKDRITISDTWPEVGNLTTFPLGCVQEVIELSCDGF